MNCFIIIFTLVLTSCTISLQNISTRGKADQVGDEELKSDAKLDASIMPV